MLCMMKRQKCKYPEHVLFMNAAQAAMKSTFLASAIRKCGGNEEKGALLYSAYGSSGQVCCVFLETLGQLQQTCFLSWVFRKEIH